jgi:hypothetical protein
MSLVRSGTTPLSEKLVLLLLSAVLLGLRWEELLLREELLPLEQELPLLVLVLLRGVLLVAQD